MSATARLALAVALTWLRPLRAVRANRELRANLDIMLRVCADLAGAPSAASSGRERHLYAIK